MEPEPGHGGVLVGFSEFCGEPPKWAESFLHSTGWSEGVEDVDHGQPLLSSREGGGGLQVCSDWYGLPLPFLWDGDCGSDHEPLFIPLGEPNDLAFSAANVIKHQFVNFFLGKFILGISSESSEVD